jgi:hypothetical protein
MFRAIYGTTDAAPELCETAIRHAVWQLTSHFESRRKRNLQTTITKPSKRGDLKLEHTLLPHETLQLRNDCCVCREQLERAHSLLEAWLYITRPRCLSSISNHPMLMFRFGPVVYSPDADLNPQHFHHSYKLAPVARSPPLQHFFHHNLHNVTTS